jgi:hypothetical protein
MNAFNRLRSPKHFYFVSYHADNNMNTKVKIMGAMGVYNYPPNHVGQARGGTNVQNTKICCGLFWTGFLSLLSQ